MIKKFCEYCGDHLEKTAASEPVQVDVGSSTFGMLKTKKYLMLAQDADLKKFIKQAPLLLSRAKLPSSTDKEAILKVIGKNKALGKAKQVDNKFRDRTKKDSPSSFEAVILLALKSENQRASDIIKRIIPRDQLTSTNRNLSFIDLEPKLLITDGGDKKIYAQAIVLSLKPLAKK